MLHFYGIDAGMFRLTVKGSVEEACHREAVATGSKIAFDKKK